MIFTTWLLLAMAADDEVTVVGEATVPGAASTTRTTVAVDELPPSAGLAEAVERAPGAVVQRLGGLGGFSAVSLRGSSTRSVEVLIDGVPLNPDGIGTVNLAELPLTAFSRVEVYRGLVPPELGSTAMGGVINLVTRGAGQSVGFGLGSWGTSRASAFHGGGVGLVAADAFATSGRFRYLDDGGTLFSDADDSDLLRENNQKRQVSLHGRGRIPVGRGTLTVGSHSLLRSTGVPGPVGSRTEQVRFGVGQQLGIAQFEGTAGAWAGEGRLWGMVRSQTLQDPRGEVGFGPQEATDRVGRLGLQGALRRGLGEHAVVGSVLQGRHERFRHTDLNEADPVRFRNVARASVHGSLFAWRDRLVFTAVSEGLVLDQRALAGGEVSSSEPSAWAVARGYFLPRAGARLRLGAFEMKTNVGRTVRPPDLLELFGNAGDQVGRADLRPERGVTADVGVAVGTGPVHAEVVGALTRQQDRIVWVLNAQRIGVPVNLDDARVLSLESSLVWQIGPGLTTSTAVTWLEATNLSAEPAYAGNQLPRIPRIEGHQSLRGEWRSLRGGATFAYTAGTFQDRTNWVQNPARPLLGADIGLALGEMVLSVEGLNLLDTRALPVPADPLSPESSPRIARALADFSGYPLPGRTWMVQVKWAP